MREFYEEATNSPPEAAGLKQEYSAMLQTMVNSTKEIYQVTHASLFYISGGSNPIPGAAGKVCACLQFVQQVVEHLQQRFVDIVAIGRSPDSIQPTQPR